MNLVVIGAQWGDEGKGKIVDYLAEEAEIVVRFSGGANAGHTICVGKNTYKLHLVPSGIILENKIVVLGCGMVIDIEDLFHELDQLTQSGIRWEGRVFVSDRAHVILPAYKNEEREREAHRHFPIGTTGRGIGVAYAMKAYREGLLVGDLFTSSWEKLSSAEKDYLASYRERLNPLVIDQVSFMRKNSQKSTLFEGAQGTLLDLDYGTYPFVSSGHSVAGGAALGGGIGPRSIDKVLGVFKAYSTRVGNGPFPTEFQEEDSDACSLIRELGHEYGTTTGRPRRIGCLDLVALKYSVWVNSLDALVLTHLDVYDTFDQIKVCTGYRLGNKVTQDFPSSLEILAKAQPIIQSFPGWKSSLSHCQSWDDLPTQTQTYLRFIEDFTQTSVDMISTGPNRTQTFQRRKAWARNHNYST